MPNTDVIPLERLELLDRLTLYTGPHRGGRGGPDCQHCARELLHEVITGEHADRTPPGVTRFAAILPDLNDGPWRDDAHRTEVMRPYLRKFLPPAFGGLDPAHDERRVYALVDHAYRKMLPELCDALKLDKEATALRALAPITDPSTAKAAADLGEVAGEVAPYFYLSQELNLARDLSREERAQYWERATREVLDLICYMP